VKFSLLLLLLAVPEVSVANSIFFNELGSGPLIDVNGLHTQGVLFGFVAGPASYNGTIGTSGNAVWSIDPVLSGPTTGILTFAFDVPVTMFQFDIVLQSIFPLDDSSMGANGGPAYTVLLSTGATWSGSTAPQLAGFYSEGQFQYSGQAIDGASISFFNGLDAGGMSVTAFGLDNLTFGVPEPATSMMMIAAGLIGVGTWKRYSSH